MQFPFLFGLVLVAGNSSLAPSRPHELPRKPLEPCAYRLTQEVSALRALYSLRITPAQRKALRKICKETMDEDRDQKKCQVSDDYRTLMEDLRKALLEAEDDERISELSEKLSELHETEKPRVDGSYEVTEAARERAPDVYKLLKPTQLVVYFAAQAEEILDPHDELIAFLETVRELKSEEWKETRDEFADEIAWQVGGLDTEISEKVFDDVAALLTEARKLTDEEFKTSRPDLEKQALAIIGEIDPADVLKHHLERTLVDLLSNPRLEDVLNASREPEK